MWRSRLLPRPMVTFGTNPGMAIAVNDAVQADLATLRGRLAPLAGAWRGS